MKMYIEWLKAANDDLILLSDIITNVKITNLIAFHSQQAVEKTLKAYLEKHDKQIPKVHKIQSLVDRVDLDLAKYDSLIQLLDSLYIDSSYPGDMGFLPYGKPTLEDAKEFYDFAIMIFEKVCQLLEVDIKEVEKQS
jgi:HEPN domain-containing protein